MKEFGPFALRIGIGGLFLTTGIMKLMNPSGVTGMLSNLGFPGATFWTWVLILAELLCGAAVLVGFKVKWVVIPLGVILFVAIVISPGGVISSVKDSVFLISLISLYLSGPGAWALDKR